MEEFKKLVGDKTVRMIQDETLDSSRRT